MAFGGSGGGRIAEAGDVSFSGLSDSQMLQYDGATAKWKNANPITGGSTDLPGLVYFDTFFSGSDDNAKMTAMNNWAKTQSGPTPAVLFGARQYNFSTPIKLFSGLKLVGGTLSPVREYSRGTIFNWSGGANSSLFIFPPEGQTGQSYPSDGSPRDITVSYIQMQGGASTHCIESYDLSTNAYAGHTLWYCQFHACGFKNFKTVWWGWGTGTSISGQTHFQSIGDTALYIGGSENSIFGSDAVSFVASSNASQTATPFMRTTMAKSTIGKCMVTARKDGTVLSIEGGHNLVVNGLEFDSQSSDPIYGAGLIIKGGDGITITNCSFKGVSANPSAGMGGASANRGWIHMSGGTQVALQGNMFRREGTSMPATNYPIIFVDNAVPAGAVKWGYNLYSGFGGAAAVIQQTAAGKITMTPDVTVTVTTAA